MVSIHLEHIIAKKNGKILKNMVSRAKKRHFLTFFAVYSKRDLRVTNFFKSIFSLPIMRLSTKSFRETFANKPGQKAMKPEFLFFARIFLRGVSPKILAKKK